MKQTTLLLLGIIASCLGFSQRLTEKLKTHSVTTITADEIGKVRIITPNELLSKEIFSASVKIEPGGKKEKDIAKNTETLNKSILDLGGNSFPLSQINSGPITLTEDFIKNLPIKITGPDGKILHQSILPGLFISPLGQSSTFQFPTHALVGSPFRIFGPFDGNSGTTKCTVGGKPAQIIAETPRQCIIEFPADAKGPTTITISENGVTVTENIGGVDFTVTAGRMNLKRGESTHLDVLITGLQNLKENATLSVTNVSTSVVTMVGGNVQVISIPPSGITGAGTYDKRYNIQSLQTGDFSININLDLPEPPISSTPSLPNWTACDLGVTTCILPGATCGQLQKGIAEKLTKEPLLSFTLPDINPYYYSKLNTDFNGKYYISSVTQTANMPIENITFTYEKINLFETQGKKKIVIDQDSVPSNGFSAQIPAPQLTPGLYNFQATAYYGSNETYTHSNYVVVPGKKNPPTVSNSEIERLRREEQRLRDSINNINRRIENGTNQINENYKRRRYLDSLRWIHTTAYNQLHRIDALIEQIPGLYGDKLKSLLDSLERFRQKAGSLNAAELQSAVDKMQQEVDDLEAALKACQEHLAALEKEQQDLKNEKDQIQKDQQQAFRDIMNELGAQGYDYAGFTSKDKSSGEFKYNYGLVLRGANGEPELVNAVPAQSLKKISELEKKIKEGNNRIKDINARQKELPGEIDKAKKECEDIAARLAKAKEALRKGTNAVTEYNFNMADLDELCSEIKRLLEPLANWCKQHPGECGSFAGQLTMLMNDCPANLGALPNLMNSLGNIIEQKKQVEQNHKKQADDLTRQINDINKANQDIGNGISNDQDKAEGFGGALDKNNQDQDNAINAELEKQQAATAAANANRKRICVEFLKGLGGGDAASEGGLLALMEALKEQIQDIGGKIGEGLGAASELTEGKTKEKIEAVNEAIEKMMEPLEKYDEYKEYVEELKDIKEKLETILSGDETPEGRAKSFGATLGLLKKVLDKIADKVPLLQFFTAYFGYLIDGYNAAIEGTYNIFRKRFKEIAESYMSKINCDILMKEYMKRNSLDDVYAKAYQLCEGGIYGDSRSAEMRRLFQEAVNQAALKKLIDCCLKWSTE